MKLTQLRIQNFRGFSDELILFDDYTCLVGPNGCGKSTVLTALNIFFRNTANAATDLVNLREEDFHGKIVTSPVKITVTFEDLEPEAQADFSHYYRQNKLIVSAVAEWDANARAATVKQYGERLGITAFAPFFKSADDGKPVGDLRTIYSELKVGFPDLPVPGTKPNMIDSLHAYEAAHPDVCQAIPSEDQFYGVSKGKNLLEKYVQWAYVPAVKDASTEQLESKKTALGILLERTVRSKISFDESIGQLRKSAEEGYMKILSDNKGALAEIAESLTNRIQEWAHPDARLALKWNDEISKAITISEPLAKILAGEGPFEGELARFGHGLQRSFLIALLQEIAGSNVSGGPRLLLACEEPELYQHPPQARHLASVLNSLTSKHAQVVVSTHSPHFVVGKAFESIRMFRKVRGSGDIHGYRYTFDDLSKTLAEAGTEKPLPLGGLALKVQQALSPVINEMFFTSVLILVEGAEDAAYVTTNMTSMGLWEEMRRLGCHIVPTGGKGSMIQPIAIAKGLQIPTFVVFDSDGHRPDNESGMRKMHEKENIAILKLLAVEKPEAFPSTTLWRSNVVMWESEIGEVVKKEFGDENWTRLGEAVKKKYDLNSVGGLGKNGSFIAYLLTEASDAKIQSASLRKLCESILAFAQSSRRGPQVAASAQKA